MKSGIWLAMILLTSFLTACGGGGGSDDVAGGSSITSGIAVDPYIHNAQFDELDSDGNIIQTSGYSDSSGKFSFEKALSDGSIIQIRSSITATQSFQAQHGGEQYTGIIKRQFFIGDEQPVVVSPLTSLIANGMSPLDVITMMNNADLIGLEESDLYNDPMATLAADNLVLLQANMAVNAFMEATQNFDYPGNAGGVSPSAASSVSFDAIADMVTASLNETLYQQMVGVYGQDFTVDDMANTAVKVNHSMIQEMVGSGSQTMPMPTFDQMLTIADVHHTRMGGGTTPPDTGTGGGTRPPANTPDGQAIFAASCIGCHTVGTSTGMMDLDGDGTKVTTKFGGGISHGGNTLAADEITAIAEYFGSTGGTTPPDTGTGGGTTPPANTPDGQAIFAASCIGCHTVGTSTGMMDLDGDGAKVTTKFGGGISHGGNTLAADEINAVAEYFGSTGGTTPPDTGTGGGTTLPANTPDGQAIFAAGCIGCHTVGTSTGMMDLDGDGTKVTTKFGGGISHGGNTLAADEITAVAEYFGSTGGTTPPDTGTGGGSTPPATATCGSCHSLPPTGNTAGAHAVHTALNGIDNDCNNCHANAIHLDDWVDLGFAVKWDAKSGTATDNGDGTCSSISCHGGQTTPDWGTGSIDVAAQCQSCHASGTSQYNGYSSGEHNKHVNGEGFACTECHDSVKLAVDHFSGLSTPGFEQSPAATLKDSMNYNNQSCTISCHGENHNSERW